MIHDSHRRNRQRLLDTPDSIADSQATYPSAQAGGMVGTPGLFTDEHVRQWKTITDRVHAKGGKIVVQLWALGRTQDGKSGIRVVSASNIPLEGKPTPEALTVDEIQSYVRDYAESAKKAMEAGFDGIEVHGARECGRGDSDTNFFVWPRPCVSLAVVRRLELDRSAHRLAFVFYAFAFHRDAPLTLRRLPRQPILLLSQQSPHRRLRRLSRQPYTLLSRDPRSHFQSHRCRSSRYPPITIRQRPGSLHP